MLAERRSGWIGLDRGADAVKIARLRRGAGGRLEAAAAVTPRWSEPDEASGETRRCRREVESARQLLGDRRGRQAAAAASMSLCTLETTDDDTPAEPTHCGDSWSVDDRQRYTLSIDQEEIATLCDGLRLAGLECRVVDGAPLAIARALRLAPGGADRLVAGLDWGVSAATYVAARDGRAVYARKLKECGFGRVVDEVARALGLTAGEAETLVQRHGVSDAGGVAADVGQALVRAAAPLLEEVRRTLSHLGAKLKTAPPDRLWVLGAGATPPGFAAWLGRELAVSAEPWRPANIDFTATAGAPACLFGQAIALSALAWGRAARA